MLRRWRERQLLFNDQKVKRLIQDQDYGLLFVFFQKLKSLLFDLELKVCSSTQCICGIAIFVHFLVDTSVYVSLRDSSGFFHVLFGLLQCSGIAALGNDYILVCV